ncbi:uncharacterized protein N7477_007016 [Penicillium maclennaniae]|uniref:uncharacterized protein n=1 Tax=Penicillium maclennaniae TaxID=1343394 RepID=UPI0025420490|nr:uncharacterized protein N7477_007016 [Penicillium maclennaniae]KAJ5668446.1 hypothetical protein N7477_007016 [Penicillium maclennaniae]
MAALTRNEAIRRLRNYVPPPTAYDQVPLIRRAAVLLLLYADPKGNLRIVITMRAKTLSSCRADTLAETPFQTARREANEEIGLPEIDLPRPFSVEHLCELPANLAKTELVVRPCVALLHSYDSTTGENADPEVSLIPQLDAREVAEVFTAPFRSFLDLKQDGRDDEWYRGSWSLWHSENWRMHQFFVRGNAFKPRGNSEHATLQDRGQGTRRVFGMTARIIVDAARLAYAREPEFEHNSHLGDEDMIAKLRRMGRLSETRSPSDELTRETMEKAKLS